MRTVQNDEQSVRQIGQHEHNDDQDTDACRPRFLAILEDRRGVREPVSYGGHVAQGFARHMVIVMVAGMLRMLLVTVMMVMVLHVVMMILAVMV